MNITYSICGVICMFITSDGLAADNQARHEQSSSDRLLVAIVFLDRPLPADIKSLPSLTAIVMNTSNKTLNVSRDVESLNVIRDNVVTTHHDYGEISPKRFVEVAPGRALKMDLLLSGDQWRELSGCQAALGIKTRDRSTGTESTMLVRMDFFALVDATSNKKVD
jgi:hypothetical protein